MAYINNNLLSNNIFLFFGQSSKNINLLDNFSTIHCKGYIFPRVSFNQIDDSNKDQKNSQVSEKSKDEQINDIDSTDIVIPIKKDEFEPENKELKDESQTNKIPSEINELFSQEGSKLWLTNNIDKYIKENKDIALIPTKSIISIITDSNDDKVHKNEKKYYETINKIVQDNIGPIKDCLNQEDNAQKRNLIPKYINNKNFPKILNPNLKFINNPIKLNNSPIYMNQNINKQIFQISPVESEILILKKRFRGRKGINDTNGDKRIHSASDDDNVLRKIQVHFLTFLVNFTNDVIRTLIEDKNAPLFKNLDYKIKKIVKHKVVEDFKSKTIGEILKSRISPKMKTYDTNANQNVYNDICNRSPLMKEFLQTLYINLFKEYYNNKDKKFEVNGKIVQLSSRTKTYNDLVLKNYQYKEKIKYVTVTYFLNSYKRRKKPNFMTYTYEK